MSTESLRRYTNLAATIHILQEKCITLLSPRMWDDRNDAFFMSAFEKQKPAQSILALCFARAPETYHHWKVFSPGADGVCIEFDENQLRTSVSGNGVVCRDVIYKQINELQKEAVIVDDLPFLKRYPYEPEKEVRFIYVDDNNKLDAMPFRISLFSIRRLTLSPWMPRALGDSVKATLRAINGCEKLKLNHSTLIESEKWKRIGDPELKRAT